MPDDWQQIAALHIESWRDAYRGMLPEDYLERQLEADRVSHWVVRLPELTAAGGLVLIAERAGQPAGFVCAEPPDRQGSVLIDNLHVRPQMKGAGIGTALLQVAQRWAADRRATGLHLYVLEPNSAARRFYAACGWQEIFEESVVMAGIDVVHVRVEYRLAANPALAIR